MNAFDFLGEFVRHHPDETALEISDQGTKVSPKFWAMGVYQCWHCEELNPIDNRRCKYCSAERFIIRTSGKKCK